MRHVQRSLWSSAPPLWMETVLLQSLLGQVSERHNARGRTLQALAGVPGWQDEIAARGIDTRGDPPMTDARVDAFLADVLALEGENTEAIHDGVHIALNDCENIFRAQEVNRRIQDKAAHACHALCRARVLEEIRRRKGTVSAEHLKVVLSVIDGPHFAAKRR